MTIRKIAPLLLSTLFAVPAYAVTLPDPDNPPVLLRTSCGESGNEIPNCFPSMPDLLNWIRDTRQPSQSNPLLVDVGPGEFGTFSCNGHPEWHVALRGSGREQTLLSGTYGVSVTDCGHLQFHSIGIKGSLAGVGWLGAGTGEWSSVDVIGTAHPYSIAAGWIDGCGSQTTAPSTHAFTDSRIRMEGGGTQQTRAFWSTCANTTFSDGEISVRLNEPSAYVYSVVLEDGANGNSGNLTVDDSLIRTIVDANTDGGAVSSVISVRATGDSTFSCENCNVNTTATIVQGPEGQETTVDLAVTAISVADQATVTTAGTSFVLNPSGAGAPTRIANSGTGTVNSPFLWGASTTPPPGSSTSEANTLISISGQDTFVETDCDDIGACASSGNETHLMVYDPGTCPAGNPWYDTVTGACRL